MKLFKKHFSLILLLLMLLIGISVRLYRFDNPVADWHSWRQADTAAVTWNFVRTKFDILHPIYFDISNVQSGKDNPHGYRYVEFPIYNAAVAGLYILFHGLTIEGWGRAVSIFASIMGSLVLYILVKRRVDRLTAWIVLISALFLPFNIYYSRTILPDTSMVAAVIASIFFLDKWLDGFREKQKPKLIYLVLSSFFLAMSLLLKPYAVFYVPSMTVLAFSVLGWKMFQKWLLWVFFVIALIPLGIWRIYILSYPEGIPVSAWLFNGNGIRFRPSFFRWIFYERLTRLIAGYTNDLFIFTGVIGIWKTGKERLFFFSFVGCALLYLCILATGNVQHDYYQIVIMPAVAILIGFGAKWCIDTLKRFVPLSAAIMIVLVILFSGFYLSWLQVRDYFNINNIAIVEAGRAIRKITPANAKLLAPYGGDTTLLYYTKRQGWPSFEHDLQTLIDMGADYLVLVNPQPNDYNIGKTYKMVSSSKDYLLYDLRKKL